MATWVYMGPMLEKRLEQAARRQGISKSEFIINAVEDALGCVNPWELMFQVKSEMAQDARSEDWLQTFAAQHASVYETDSTRANLMAHLRAKHDFCLD